MASSGNSQGYQCEFIDTVNTLFYCSKCSLVARRITLTSCCGESYCHACIADSQLQGQPCPACGEATFTTTSPAKFLKQIESLKVFCSVKGRGCGWSGTLGELDAHLDPDQDNCQYVDTKCPLNCQQTIPKNKVEQHVAQECTKRDYTCQHCAFKATYEEVVDVHLPECKYVPVQCPNFCGVCYDREDMEDHMKTCRLEEVACEFSGVGCEGVMKREEQENHSQQSHKNHSLLTAVKLEEHMRKQEEIIREQKESNETLLTANQNLENTVHELQMKQKKQEETMRLLLQEQQKIKMQLKTFSNHFLDKYEFEFDNFRSEKDKGASLPWMSPSMYTHPFGYKFCIGIHANGVQGVKGKALSVSIWKEKGEFDETVKLPVKARITIQLLHPGGGENIECSTADLQWYRGDKRLCYFNRRILGSDCGFIEHDRIQTFLNQNKLLFKVSDVTIL